MFNKHQLHYFWIFIIIAIAILFYCIGAVSFYLFPKIIFSLSSSSSEAINKNDQSTFVDFSSEIAYQYLQQLSKIGVRSVGTPENEQSTIKFLFDQIETIKYLNDDNHFEISTDLQVANGYFSYGNEINVFQGLQNFIVKVSMKNSQSKNHAAILLNSHFDSSPPDSPGAGDDGTMVAVMLETLRALVVSRTFIKHSVIFLFNGAEGTGYQGSYGFISQHEWAKNIRAFINLDSAGNGGKEILFRFTQTSPFILKCYSANAIHPFATSIAQDIFNQDLIPSNTDFTIFQRFSRAPGLDLAFIYNGYVYHTKYDRLSSIPLETLQHAGDNIFAISKAFANSEEIDHQINTSSVADDELHQIFFDLFGLYLITYSNETAFILNLTVSGAAIIIITCSTLLMKRNSFSFYPITNLFKHVLMTLIIYIAAILVGCAVTIALATIYSYTNLTMFWFTNIWLISGCYLSPLFFVLSFIPAIYLKFSSMKNLFHSNRVQLFAHAHCLLLSLANIFITVFLKYDSCYILTISISFYSLSVLINMCGTIQNKSWYWLIAFFICQIFPFTYFSYLLHIVLTSFIPITGRTEHELIDEENLVAGICLIFGFLTTGFILLAFSNFKKAHIITACIFLGYWIISIILIMTPLGFPYQAETTPKRVDVSHVQKVVFNNRNKIIGNVSGYYIQTFDKTKLDLLEENLRNIELIPVIKPEKALKYNEQSSNLNPSHWWSDTKSSPILSIEPNLKLLEKKWISKKITRFYFSLYGPSHMTVQIRASNSTLIGWSFKKYVPNRIYNRLKFLYGLNADPYEFYLDFKHDEIENICKISVIGHFIKSFHQNQSFIEFLKLFPKWTAVRSSITSEKIWEF